jgi:glucose repression regulatory protein TUP1
LSSDIYNTLQGHGSAVNSISFAHDGYRIASGSSDGTVRLWDIDSGQNTLSLRTAKDIMAVAFSPDSGYVAIGLVDGFIRVWDVQRGHVLTHPEGFAWHYGLCSLAWSPNGEGLVSGSNDGTVKMWDLRPLAGTTDLRHARLMRTLQARGASCRPQFPSQTSQLTQSRILLLRVL